MRIRKITGVIKVVYTRFVLRQAKKKQETEVTEIESKGLHRGSIDQNGSKTNKDHR